MTSPNYSQFLSTVSLNRSFFLIQKGRFDIRLAETEAELDAVLALRYQVFNVELGEGLASSSSFERDFDSFDSVFDHIIVIDRENSQIVGTYRIQTYEMALKGLGFYSANEFSFANFPVEDLKNSVEIGRACIAKPYRNGRILFLIWNGIYEYVSYYKKRYIFGCSSFPSSSREEALKAMAYFYANSYLDLDRTVTPLPEFSLFSMDDVLAHPVSDVVLPSLFRIYLEFGAKICGLPAIDREFQTIDFLTLVTATHVYSSMDSLVDAKQKLK